MDRRMKKALVIRALMMAINLRKPPPGLIYHSDRGKAPNLTTLDRFTFAWLAMLLSPNRTARSAIIIQPSTLLKFHKVLVRRKYLRLFSSYGKGKSGPKGPNSDLIKAIVEIKRRNPRYGCPRIALIITNTFGIELNKDVVRRVLMKYYHPRSGDHGGPSWLSFLASMKDSLWSIDLFCCESISLKTHWVLVVMDVWNRSIIGFSTHAGSVDGPTVCQMFNQITATKNMPLYISTDHDPLFQFHRWKANLRILEIEKIKSIPFTPISHPYIERLIGTVRREFLDQTLFWNEIDLQKKLNDYTDYYNNHRVHASLNGTLPAKCGEEKQSPLAALTNYGWNSLCRGLYQLPIPT